MIKQQSIVGDFSSQYLFSVSGSSYPNELLTLISEQVDKEHAYRFFIYVNSFSFITLFLAANGLGVNELITIVVSSYLLFAFTLVINVVDYIRQKIDSVRILITCRQTLSYLVYDFCLSCMLIFNALSEQSAPVFVSVIAAVVTGFMSLAVSPRSMVEFAVGKVFVLIVSIVLLFTEPVLNITIVFSLLVSFILVSVPAYWMIVIRIRMLDQYLREQAVIVQLRQETQLRERLLVYVGHDLRQPINALGMLLHTLPEDDLSIIEAKECVRSSKRLIGDIVQLADFGKELSAHYESFPIQLLFDSIKLEYSYAASQADCQLRIVDSSIVLNNDFKLISRIIKNFLTNAIVHAPGFNILIGVRRRSLSVDILVIDNGPGVPDKDKGTLFEDFVQGEQSAGLGLGLAIAEHYAAVCDAKILFNTNLGKGSCFGVADLARAEFALVELESCHLSNFDQGCSSNVYTGK